MIIMYINKKQAKQNLLMMSSHISGSDASSDYDDDERMDDGLPVKKKHRTSPLPQENVVPREETQFNDDEVTSTEELLQDMGSQYEEDASQTKVDEYEIPKDELPNKKKTQRDTYRVDADTIGVQVTERGDTVPRESHFKAMPTEQLKYLIDLHKVEHPIAEKILGEGGYWPQLPMNCSPSSMENQYLTLFNKQYGAKNAKKSYKPNQVVQVLLSMDVSSLRRPNENMDVYGHEMSEIPSLNNAPSISINLKALYKTSEAARYRTCVYMEVDRAPAKVRKSKKKKEEKKEEDEVETVEDKRRTLFGVPNNIRLVYDAQKNKLLFQANTQIRENDELLCDYGLTVGNRIVDDKMFKSANKQKKVRVCNDIPMHIFLMDKKILNDYRSVLELTCHYQPQQTAFPRGASWEVDRTNWTVRACLMVLYFTNNSYWISSCNFALITCTKTSIINAMLRKFMHETLILVKRDNAKDGNVPSSYWKLARPPGSVFTPTTGKRMGMFREYLLRLPKCGISDD